MQSFVTTCSRTLTPVGNNPFQQGAANPLSGGAPNKDFHFNNSDNSPPLDISITGISPSYSSSDNDCSSELHPNYDEVSETGINHDEHLENGSDSSDDSDYYPRTNKGEIRPCIESKLPETIVGTGISFSSKVDAENSVTFAEAKNGYKVVFRREKHTYFKCSCSGYHQRKLVSTNKCLGRDSCNKDVDYNDRQETNCKKRKFVTLDEVTNCNWKGSIKMEGKVYVVNQINCYHNHYPAAAINLTKQIIKLPGVQNVIDENITIARKPKFTYDKVDQYLQENYSGLIGTDTGKYLQLGSIQNYMHHCNTVELNPMERLLKVLLEVQKDRKNAFQYFIHQHKKTQEFKALFFFDDEYQKTIAYHYPYILSLDSTFTLISADYFVNRVKLKTLLVVVGDNNNNFYLVGTCIYHPNHSKEKDFNWMVDKIKSNLFDQEEQPKPNVIITDRELAMVNAVKTIFPSTYYSLCTLHMKRDITSWLLKYIGKYIVINKAEEEMKERVLKFAKSVVDHLCQLLLYDKDYGIDEEIYKERKSTFIQSLQDGTYFDIYLDQLQDIGEDTIDLNELCTKYLEYLNENWLKYDKMIANVYRLKSGFAFGHDTTNAVESVVNLTKYQQGYCSKSIIDFVRNQQKHAKVRYDNFRQGQVRKRINILIMNQVGDKIFNKLINGYVGKYAIRVMVTAIIYGVQEYEKNPRHPTYSGTCTLLTIKSLDDTGEVVEGNYVDLFSKNAKAVGIPCTCYSHGIYCTEFLVVSYGRDWKDVCDNWNTNKKVKLSKNSHELKQKHIAGRWLRRVNKDGDKSIPTLYIKNYDDTVDKYQKPSNSSNGRKKITSNSQEEGCSSNNQMPVRHRSVMETHRFTLNEQRGNSAFLRSIGLFHDKEEE